MQLSPSGVLVPVWNERDKRKNAVNRVLENRALSPNSRRPGARDETHEAHEGARVPRANAWK